MFAIGSDTRSGRRVAKSPAEDCGVNGRPDHSVTIPLPCHPLTNAAASGPAPNAQHHPGPNGRSQANAPLN
jgi:hypothetical protein